MRNTVKNLKFINFFLFFFIDLDDGLDYNTFQNGIYQVFVQSENLAKRIFNTIDFNYSGFLNWDEFLNLMVIIRAKTLKEKIDLFIKVKKIKFLSFLIVF